MQLQIIDVLLYALKKRKVFLEIILSFLNQCYLLVLTKIQVTSHAVRYKQSLKVINLENQSHTN